MKQRSRSKGSSAPQTISRMDRTQTECLKDVPVHFYDGKERSTDAFGKRHYSYNAPPESDADAHTRRQRCCGSCRTKFVDGCIRAYLSGATTLERPSRASIAEMDSYYYEEFEGEEGLQSPPGLFDSSGMMRGTDRPRTRHGSGLNIPLIP